MQETQIVVIGAGPTGLTAANLLGQAGIRTRVFERAPGLCDHPRAITLDDEGQRVLQAIGLVSKLPMKQDIQVRYLSGCRTLARVAPKEQPNGFPPIVTFHQPALETLLFDGLKRFATVSIHFHHRVTAIQQQKDAVTVSGLTEQGERFQVRCNYVLACDGGRSDTRHMLNIPLRRPSRLLFGRPQRWLVVDCIDDNEDSTIFFFCNPARPAVTVPAPGRRRRWEFMLFPHEHALPTREEVQTLIRQARQSLQPSARPHPAHIERHTIYTFYALYAQRMRCNRVFLLGDAAHLMPPFGGQGLNSGLRDVHNLCWKLCFVLQRGAAPTLLSSYEQERQPHISQMIRFSSLPGTLIMSVPQPLARIRDLLIRGIMFSPIRHAIREIRIKPQPRYQKGLLLPASERHLIGRILPQATVQTEQGQVCCFDEIAGNHFALIRLYEDPTTAFQALEEWYFFNCVCICVLPASQPLPGLRLPSTLRCVQDSMGTIERLYRGKRDLFLLVRPDRFIMSAFTLKEASTVLKRLHTLLGYNIDAGGTLSPPPKSK